MKHSEDYAVSIKVTDENLVVEHIGCAHIEFYVESVPFKKRLLQAWKLRTLKGFLDGAVSITLKHPDYADEVRTLFPGDEMDVCQTMNGFYQFRNPGVFDLRYSHFPFRILWRGHFYYMTLGPDGALQLVLDRTK